MTIVINSLTITQSLSFTTKSDVQGSSNLTPNSVSPVLKTAIDITIDASFPYTLVHTDFTITATSTSNANYVRHLNPLSVTGADTTDTTRTVRAMFGGALSGTFNIAIRHRVYGLLNTNAMTLVVRSEVTNVTPLTGSIYGGTLLTITGTNFGTKKTDNPVQISTSGGIGSIDCFVQTITTTQITCRVDPDMKTAKTDGTTGEVITFLKTSEEAVCTSPTCAWTYTSTLPSITASGMTAAFDTTTSTW